MQTIGFPVENFPKMSVVYMRSQEEGRDDVVIGIVSNWTALNYCVIQAMLDTEHEYYVSLGGKEKVPLTDENLFKKVDARWPQCTRLPAALYTIEVALREGTEEDRERAFESFNITFPELALRWKNTSR